MSKTLTLRSIRLLPASYGIENLSYERGEVFFDTNTAKLRVMDGATKGGFPIATEEFVNTELQAVESDLQGQINAAIAAIPEVDLTPYYTKTETDVLLANVSVDLTGYATETYVNNKIAAIPSVDLTGYATEVYVDDAITDLIDGAPGALDTLNELSAALGDDENFATTITNGLALKANIADLGTAAYEDTTFFATAFQGSLADSALQPLDNVSTLVNDAGYLVSTDLTGLASETYVDTAITNLIDGAPESLDTLNELAAALNDNANIGSEVLAAIALKANTADLGAVAFSNDYTDLDNAEDWANYGQKYRGRFTASTALGPREPVVLNLDKTVSSISQTQSYVFDTFTTYQNINGNTLSIPNNRGFSPTSDSYGSLRNGPQSHQYARLGNYIFTLTPTNNDAYLSAFTEDPTTGELQHIRSDLFENYWAFHTGGIVTCSLAADTVNDQLVICAINSGANDGMYYRIVGWNSTDNLFTSGAFGSVDVTVDGQLLGNNQCQKIAAFFNSNHNKLYVGFDYGNKAYFASYMVSGTGAGVTADTYINTPTSTQGAAVLFQAYEPMTYMPTVDNYLIVWGYNTTSMVSVVLDNVGDPSWGTEVQLDNMVQDVMVNTSISRLGVLTQPSNQAAPEVYMFTFQADGTFSSQEASVTVDDGTASAFNNTSRGHYDSRTDQYLVYSYFNNGSTNRQRPAHSKDGKTWTFESDQQAGDARVVDGHFSGDVAVHQLLFQNNRDLRKNLYTTTTGPIVSNLTADNLIGVSSGNFTQGQTNAEIFVQGDTIDGFTNLSPGEIYYVSTSGGITNTSAVGSVILGTAVDQTQINITLDDGGSGASVSVSDNPPVTATDGDLWWESDSGRLKVYYEDADTAQWVDASPPITQPNVPYIVGSITGAIGNGAGYSHVNSAVGVYDITFDTSLSYIDYALFISLEDSTNNYAVSSKGTAGFTVTTTNSGGTNTTMTVHFTVYNQGP